ncbi:MAG: SH3 domain-containing protein [Anaerolineae bacterium]|nr:SH3 domain-containing protein [Anaerolineae bacterium]
MNSKLGFQCFTTLPAMRFLERVGRAAALKILDPQMDAGIAIWMAQWARSRGIPLIFRHVGFFDHRTPYQSPEEHLAELWANFYSGWPRDLFPDYLELFNEDDSSLHGVQAHVGYYLGREGRRGAIQILEEWSARKGRRIKGLLFNFSTGTPPEGVKAPLIRGAAYGVHEYAVGQEGGRFDLAIPHHVGRYMRWIPDAAEEIFITETNVEMGGHRRFGIPPSSVFRALDEFYARDARVKAFLWFVVGSIHGWQGYDLVGQEEEVRAYLEGVPPSVSPAPPSPAPPPGNTRLLPGDLVQVVTPLNLRAGPGREYAVLRVLNPGEILGVYRVRGTWAEVVAVADRRRGWCHTGYVRLWERLAGEGLG